jgi:hypothetical protein
LTNTEYIDKYIKSQRIKVGGILRDWKIQNQITNWNPTGVRTKDSQRTD